MYCFREYVNELDIISQLPQLSPIQQVQLDISLHNDAVNKGTFGRQSSLLSNDSLWKHKLAEIFQGKEKNPEVIKQTIDIVEKDLNSHLGRPSSSKTGSLAWHQAWINVYQGWLRQLQAILGALNGT